MADIMKQFQDGLLEVEIEAENLLLARHQLVENDRLRNGNREALTALRKKARATKTSKPSPFESLMREIGSRPLVKEVCGTCGNHVAEEKTWLMFPGTDVFAAIPFHAAHTILEKDQAGLDFEAKTLQSLIKEKSLSISEGGVLADRISPGVLRSLVTLTDESKTSNIRRILVSVQPTAFDIKLALCVHRHLRPNQSESSSGPRHKSYCQFGQDDFLISYCSGGFISTSSIQ